MQDTIIKGEGTSRSLKIPASKAVVYQDVSAMVQDMVSGNFLFDLGPIRLEGVTQKGMDLNKANLLTDATAALYGKESNASPDEILAAIKALIETTDGKIPKIATGSYSGTDSNDNKTVSIGFKAKLVLLLINNQYTSYGTKYGGVIFGANNYLIGIESRQNVNTSNEITDILSVGSISSTGITILAAHKTWFNHSGSYYQYVALG